MVWRKPIYWIGSTKDDLAVYTVKLGEVVYALDAFKKKSTKGDNLPKRDRERIEARLKAARAIDREARG